MEQELSELVTLLQSMTYEEIVRLILEAGALCSGQDQEMS